MNSKQQLYYMIYNEIYCCHQVLDIAGPAPQPSLCVGLMLRRPDKRRKSTQTWRFTDDGRLCCVHNNMCVQAKDGFLGLRHGTCFNFRI